MGWPDLVRKYVWDEEKTPYLVPADRLTPAQARSELRAYALLLGILGAAVALLGASGSPRAGGLGALGVALYGLSLAAAAVVLARRRHRWAARYCATAPVAVLAGALAGALRPDMTPGERLALALFGALWLRYAVRVVRITRGPRADT